MYRPHLVSQKRFYQHPKKGPSFSSWIWNLRELEEKLHLPLYALKSKNLEPVKLPTKNLDPEI
jgi:hypothetical protein